MEMYREKYFEILKDISQPQRYYSPEKGFIIKEKPLVNVLLTFPDLYEIGMAHYGFQLLYFLGNSIHNIQVERAFLPWFDLKEKMLHNSIPLLSNETQKPALSFPLICFTIPTPMHFTNVIYALELSKIPLKWEQRSDKDPIIVGGGMALSNPAPLFDIFDVIAIGDGEILFPKILEVFKEKEKRIERLEELSKIEGLIVPPLKKEKTKRVILRDLKEQFLFKPIVPSFPSVHNRFTIEIMKGCPWGCRFCQAGFWYRPYRESNLEEIYKFLIKNAPFSGFTEVGLLSLSSSDLSSIFPFCKNLIEYLKKYNISISMPSLRIDSLSFPLIEILQKIRKSSLTFAPETSEPLRKKINKPIKDEEILKVLIKAKNLGWKNVKFYFMLGLPFEEEKDLKEIIYLIEEVKKIGFPSISLNISNFVPKPWTPFQNYKMISLSELYEKQNFLKKKLKIKAKFTNPKISFIEERLSRGGRGLSDFLIELYKKGHFFDCWDEYVKVDEYLSILPESKICENPWEHFIDFDINKDFFEREFERAKEGIITVSCQKGCANCMENCKIERKREVSFELFKEENKEKKERITYKFYITKIGKAKFLSYTNYLNFISSYLISKKYPISFSSGYNPHPIMSAENSLPVGVESLEEIIYFNFFDQISIEGEEISEGIMVVKVEKVEKKDKFKGILFEYKNKKMILKSHKDLKIKDYFNLKKIKNLIW